MSDYFHVVQEPDLNKITGYLEGDIAGCPYMYVDICVYGLSNPNMQIWYGGELDNIQIIVMKYHDSFQIYSSSNKWSKEALRRLIEQEDPRRITANEVVAEELQPMIESKYKCTYGIVFYQKMARNESNDDLFLDECKMADKADIPEIADLLLLDPENSSQYTKAELQQQFLERFETKMGRSLVIRENEKIVGHMGTVAESDKVAILSGFMIMKEYRSSDYFIELFQKLRALVNEKDIYFLVINKRHARLYAAWNLEECCNYAKFIKI